MDLEEIAKLKNENGEKISKNEELINANVKSIESNFEKIQKNSYALDILKDYKSESKKWFTILLIVLVMWFATICYLVYVLNDMGVYEETTQEVTDFNTINGNVVNKGDVNGEN